MENKYCYNIKYDSYGSTGWIDFSKLRVVPNEEEMPLLFNSDKVTAAKENEFKIGLIMVYLMK